MKRTEIAALFRQTPPDGTPVTVCGWAKTVRDSKNIGFLSLSDGSCFKPVQVVFEAAKLANYKEIAKAGVGTSLKVEGALVLTPGAKQPSEVNASAIAILGACGSRISLAEKAAHGGVSAHHAAPARTHQHVFRRVPRAQRRRLMPSTNSARNRTLCMCTRR